MNFHFTLIAEKENTQILKNATGDNKKSKYPI